MRSRRARVMVAACAVLAAALVGCASAPADPDWRGRKTDEAIARYGPPTQMSASETGTLYVWRMRHELHGMGGLPGSTRETRVTIRMMTVDPNGVITSNNLSDQ